MTDDSLLFQILSSFVLSFLKHLLVSSSSFVCPYGSFGFEEDMSIYAEKWTWLSATEGGEETGVQLRSVFKFPFCANLQKIFE
jgi:hypothetical protein